MIEQKTVFILGAGATEPFGFPIGMGLRDGIINFIGETRTVKAKFLEIFEQCGHSYHEILLFRDNLIKSQKKSVDAFLEHRTEYIKLGKLLITNNLLVRENLNAIYKNPDWYGYIWDKLNSKFEDFDKNSISFITFNYDRTLETYLINSMMALYNKNEIECYEKLKKINIIHVHGKIGKNKYEDKDNFTAFGERIQDYNKLITTADNIKIIHEDISNDKEFSMAHNLLQEASLVVILGLGYDETNLKRLKINEVMCKIIGSSFSLTEMECKSINKKFPRISFSSYGYQDKALEFLRHRVMLD